MLAEQVMTRMLVQFLLFIHLEDGDLEQVIKLIDTLENVMSSFEHHDRHKEQEELDVGQRYKQIT